MAKPHFRILTGKLSPGNHHFSTVVYLQSGDEVRYYELKSKYHGKYPASKLFRRVWDWAIRPTRDVAAAVIWRAEKTLARAKIKPEEFKYMTTAVMPATSSRPSRFRHVVGVRLRRTDFDRLKQAGMLRELYRGDVSNKEAMRDAMFGILPLAIRVPDVA